MKKLTIHQLVIIIFLGMALISLKFTLLAAAQEKKEWTGKLADGTVITENDLRSILEKHKRWFETGGQEGERDILKNANLQGANLREADLRRAILRDTNLQGADLRMAKLERTSLERVNLTGADLRGADLKEAKLWDVTKGRETKLLNADFSNANLEGVTLSYLNSSNAKFIRANLRGVSLVNTDLAGADLRGADLTEAFLRGANLHMANLSEAKLKAADFENANLRGANLAGAQLEKANLYKTSIDGAIGLDPKWKLVWELVNQQCFEHSFTGADLSGAYLRNAKMVGADLRRADLREADLGDAILGAADLTGADLTGASLRGAYLYEANLGGADLTGASLRGAYLYEANLGGATLSKANLSFATLTDSYFEPADVRELLFLGAKGLSTIHFHNFVAVAELRKMAREAGLRREDRALSSALRKYRLQAAPFYERIFEYILLDLPTDSGANPWRSLMTLFLFIPVFSIPYIIVLRRPANDGIWRVWLPDRVRKDLGEDEPVRLILRGFEALRIAFYFSILSAFSIGWRELDVGNWIARIQRREYTYRATGLARTISGCQSLLSVYFLALWALTYFGRPFE